MNHGAIHHHGVITRNRRTWQHHLLLPRAVTYGRAHRVSLTRCTEVRVITSTTSQTDTWGDQNEIREVFVRDRTLGITLRAVGADGEGGNGSSSDGTISADGHYVAFESRATNLWPSTDENGSLTDVFEFDVWANSLAGHLSVGPDDVWANGSSSWPAISGDGLYVAYYSRATNLITLNSNATDDIFTHFWVDEFRTQCDTKRRSKPLPVPLPFGRVPAPPKPDYDRKCQDSVGTQQDPAPNLGAVVRPIRLVHGNLLVPGH